MGDEQRLRAVDAFWLDAEKSGPSIAIGGVFEVAGPAPTVDEVREFVASRLDRIPRFQERLSPSTGGLKRPTWESVEADLSHHIQQIALDEDGTSLEDAVSTIMERPMDLTAPLWDIHLLTGLPDGRFALAVRMHHAAADGQGSMFAFGNLVDVDPEGKQSLTDVFAAAMSEQADRGADGGADANRSSRSLVLSAAAQGSDFTMRALRASLEPGTAVAKAGRQATAQLGRTAEGVRAIASPRTQSLIGGDPGVRRYWHTTQVSLADVKAIKNALGGTVNDVVMTLVSGGYATMMDHRGQDTSGQYLKVNIPVSVRSPGDLATNNQVTALFIQLPVSGSAAERLEWIRTHINTVKQAGTADALKVITDLLNVAPALIQTATVSRGAVLAEWMLDTLVTNVPGPPFATYVMGRRIGRNMPIVALGTPLWSAVAVVSYDGLLTFGISTGEGGKSAGADICEGVRTTLEELVTAASQARPESPQPQRYPMAADDSLWLDVERPEQSTMVDAALLLGEQVDVDAIRRVVQERIVDRFPIMRQRPVQVDGQWFWEDDTSFELEHHVIDVRLANRDLESARRYISRQRSTLLSRTAPMWAFHVIRDVEGLGPDGGTGTIVLTRFHHSIADGIRLVQVLLGTCDPVTSATVPKVGRKPGQSSGTRRAADAAMDISAGARDIVGATAGTAGDAARRLATSASQLRDEALRTVTDPLGTARRAPGAAVRLWGGTNSMVTTVFGQGAETLTRPGRLVDAAVVLTSPDNRVANTMGAAVKLALPNPTARTVWSGQPGPVKDAYWCPPISMDDIEAIRSRQSASVNDILLAILAGTLTEYLREHGETSVTSTGWFIPASIKPLDENLPENLGNHFVGLILELPIGIDDPAELLAAVTGSMTRIKNSDEAFLAFGLQRVVLRLPSTIAGKLFDTTFAKVNGSLVSVPGPRGPMTLAGHHVEAVLAFSPTVGNGSLAVTLFSYNGQVTMSMSVDRTLIPDGHRLAALFTEQAQRFVAALAQ